MMCRTQTYTSALRLLLISLLLLVVGPAFAQKHIAEAAKKDSTRLFRGIAVSVDVVGAAQMHLSSYGQYEGGVHVNLKDKFFVVFEGGLGKADADDPTTELRYKTSAPYGKVGVDFNLTKNKHDIYRVIGGVRYAFTSFKYDVEGPTVKDPKWGDETSFAFDGVKCSQHWMELVAGVDAKVAGPLRMGWTVRYRRRLVHSDGDFGIPWYVPGYGRSGMSRLGGTFNLTFEL